MKYKVEFTEGAQAEADAEYLWIAERAPAAAIRWFNGLEDEIAALERYPKRCGVAPESFAFRQEIRQLIYGSYRVLFTIERRTVRILHVRHAAMKDLRP